MRWEDMSGDDRTRHCAECNLNVHNIAGMTRGEAEALLARHFNPDGEPIAGRFCAQIYRRADGTVLTADCPVGLAALRAKARRTVVRIAAAVGITSFVGFLAAAESRNLPFANTQPLSTVAAWLRNPGPNPAAMMRGKIALPGAIRITPPPAPNGAAR